MDALEDNHEAWGTCYHLLQHLVEVADLLVNCFLEGKDMDMEKNNQEPLT